jgi:hypothetical protein
MAEIKVIAAALIKMLFTPGGEEFEFPPPRLSEDIINTLLHLPSTLDFDSSRPSVAAASYTLRISLLIWHRALQDPLGQHL